MIIKRLGNNPAAQRCQRAELDRHLKRQHADRQIYYLSRARSRLDASSSAPVTITCILDSMDQAKHSWPRSKAMQAKQFANFNRPRLIQTTMLCHGHGMVMALSPHHVSANSSRSCEVIAAGLTLLERQRMVDMRQVTLSIQGDNSSKELKNMSCLRMLALKTALGHLKASEMSFLSSGHSHEDIDAFFAVARKWLEKSRELWVPEAFRESLQQFVDNPAVRPYEKFRKVVLMSQYRNWKLSFNIMMTSFGGHNHSTPHHHLPSTTTIEAALQEALAVHPYGTCPIERNWGSRGSACFPVGTIWRCRTLLFVSYCWFIAFEMFQTFKAKGPYSRTHQGWYQWRLLEEAWLPKASIRCHLKEPLALNLNSTQKVSHSFYPFWTVGPGDGWVTSIGWADPSYFSRPQWPNLRKDYLRQAVVGLVLGLRSECEMNKILNKRDCSCFLVVTFGSLPGQRNGPQLRREQSFQKICCADASNSQHLKSSTQSFSILLYTWGEFPFEIFP